MVIVQPFFSTLPRTSVPLFRRYSGSCFQGKKRDPHTAAHRKAFPRQDRKALDKCRICRPVLKGADLRKTFPPRIVFPFRRQNEFPDTSGISFYLDPSGQLIASVSPLSFQASISELILVRGSRVRTIEEASRKRTFKKGILKQFFGLFSTILIVVGPTDYLQQALFAPITPIGPWIHNADDPP